MSSTPADEFTLEQLQNVSGDEEESDQGPLPQQSGSIDVDALLSELQNTQLHCGQLEQALRATKIDRDALYRENQLLKVSKQKGAVIDSVLATETARIHASARKYTCLVEPFLDPSILGMPRPNVSPLSGERFATEQSAHDGKIAELWDFLPESLHGPLLDRHDFDTEFKKVAGSELSQVRFRVKNVPHRILDLPDKLFANWAKRGDNIELQKRVKKALDGEYDIWAPILYKDLKAGDKSALFRNDALPLILRAVLFGPSSLDPSGPKKASKKPKGAKWELDRTTPSMVALAAMLARWLCSPDDRLDETGSTSRINYQESFQFYKAFLITAYNSKFAKDLFSWFDQQLGFVRRASSDSPAIDGLTSLPASEEPSSFASRLQEAIANLDTITITDTFEDQPSVPEDGMGPSIHLSHSAPSRPPTPASGTIPNAMPANALVPLTAAPVPTVMPAGLVTAATISATAPQTLPPSIHATVPSAVPPVATVTSAGMASDLETQGRPPTKRGRRATAAQTSKVKDAEGQVAEAAAPAPARRSTRRSQK